MRARSVEAIEATPGLPLHLAAMAVRTIPTLEPWALPPGTCDVNEAAAPKDALTFTFNRYPIRRLTPSSVRALLDGARSWSDQVKALVPAAHILQALYLDGGSPSQCGWPARLDPAMVDAVRTAVSEFFRHRPAGKESLLALPLIYEVVAAIEARQPKLQDWTRAFPKALPGRKLKRIIASISDRMRQGRSTSSIPIRWPGDRPVQMRHGGVFEVRWANFLEFSETRSTVFVQDVGKVGFRLRYAPGGDILAEAVDGDFRLLFPFQDLADDGLCFQVQASPPARHGGPTSPSVLHELEWRILQPD